MDIGDFLVLLSPAEKNSDKKEEKSPKEEEEVEGKEKEIWSISIKRQPFLIDLSELSLDEEEERQRKEKIDSFSSIPNPKPADHWGKIDYPLRMEDWERIAAALCLGDVAELKRWISRCPQDYLNQLLSTKEGSFTPLELLIFRMMKSSSWPSYEGLSRRLGDDDYMNCLKLLVKNGGKCSSEVVEEIFSEADGDKDDQEKIREMIQDSMDSNIVEFMKGIFFLISSFFFPFFVLFFYYYFPSLLSHPF